MSRKIIIVLIAAILVIAGVTLFTVLIGRIMSMFSQHGLPALAQTEEANSGDTDSMPAVTNAGIQTDERTTSKPDAFETVGSTESIDDDPSVRSVYTVIVDPGHGFTDEGCSSDLIGDFTEKELTLTMAEELRSILEGYGVNVIMLHDGKSFPSLTELTAFADYYDIEYNIDKCVDNNIFSAYERTIYANYLSKINAVDFFISIHVNAMENNPDYSGFEIDYCAENESSSVSKIFFDSI